MEFMDECVSVGSKTGRTEVISRIIEPPKAFSTTVDSMVGTLNGFIALATF
jgi:hypothetical protein